MKHRPIQLIPCNDLPAVEVLIASLCYLMTQYAREPDVELAPQIQRHLHLLEGHPDCTSDLLRVMCRRLSCHWLGLVQGQTASTFPDQFIHQESTNECSRMQTFPAGDNG